MYNLYSDHLFRLKERDTGMKLDKIILNMNAELTTTINIVDYAKGTKK